MCKHLSSQNMAYQLCTSGPQEHYEYTIALYTNCCELQQTCYEVVVKGQGWNFESKMDFSGHFQLQAQIHNTHTTQHVCTLCMYSKVCLRLGNTGNLSTTHTAHFYDHRQQKLLMWTYIRCTTSPYLQRGSPGTSTDYCKMIHKVGRHTHTTHSHTPTLSPSHTHCTKL